MAPPKTTPMRNHLYQTFLQPRSSDPDQQRREFILNVLLSGLFIISCISVVAIVIDLLVGQVVNGRSSIVEVGSFSLIIAAFWRLSRAGWHHVISYILLVCVGALALALVLQWSFELPMAELAYGFMIVVSGVLLTARAALLFSALAVLVLMLVSWAQVSGRLHPRTDWLDQPLVFSDIVGYTAIFGVIGLVSWLANREIDRSLYRAHSSEAALALERDSLEVKVQARTRELKTAQLLRTMELQRFAEFGRVNANLLHEIANPLTAVSLNLQQFDGRQSRLVLQARQSLQQLERYLGAARKQLQHRSRVTTFSVSSELNQVKQVLQPLADKRQIKMLIKKGDSHKLYGDPIKFSQIVTNLVVNGFDAYPDKVRSAKPRLVLVSVEARGQWLELHVIDWGKGIAGDQLSQVFEPFYITKTSNKRGLVIGLAMVKQFAEQDFHGQISVSSSPTEGTRFTVSFKLPRP